VSPQKSNKGACPSLPDRIIALAPLLVAGAIALGNLAIVKMTRPYLYQTYSGSIQDHKVRQFALVNPGPGDLKNVRLYFEDVSDKKSIITTPSRGLSMDCEERCKTRMMFDPVSSTYDSGWMPAGSICFLTMNTTNITSMPSQNDATVEWGRKVSAGVTQGGMRNVARTYGIWSVIALVASGILSLLIWFRPNRALYAANIAISSLTDMCNKLIENATEDAIQDAGLGSIEDVKSALTKAIQDAKNG